ncbi:hypothetical protein Nham_1712 [Nitrobacter hamburgensis X14]|uniref:Uncharacterized protein n=1 Tax=Nitrobacter hamburgensis (strain DSM 10229 / NCIMB 13809 / X14) TaxID=323097 RepID=Q1QML9_NITHX|nr:hypothetical protein [Nitrobacter hamburgensis]ABE62528.1 hypothetical protein Nham_1712 [Nitrobacter hamburgensis X14]
MSGHFSKRKRYALDVEAWVQFKLLRMAALHPETTKADLAVFAEIIQRYKGWSGNGFVSDHELCDLTGLSDRTVGRARQHMVSLEFVQVVRAGGRGHATVYTPNFSLVPQKGDTGVTDKKGDIPVTETDENVTLNGSYGDTSVTPSYPQDRFLTGPLRDRHDSAPATPPRAAGLVPAAGEAPEEELTLGALLTAYVPADMSKPARAAYKRAWGAVPPDADLSMVIQAAADWHESWGAQNNPNAPRMSLVRWLKDEMFRKPAPKGFNKVERPAKLPDEKFGTGKAKPAKPRKPAGPTTARITAANVMELGHGSSELHFATTDEDGAVLEHVIILEHHDGDTQYDGQKQLGELVRAAGLNQIEDPAELLGRTIILTGDDEEFAAPTTRPDDEPPIPERPEPVRHANQTESTQSAAEFAERMAATLNDADWPDWLDAA